MNEREAIKQALGVLEENHYLIEEHERPEYLAMYDRTITALRQALAQPEQEPVAWMYPDDYRRMTTSETFCTVYSVEVGSATRGETTVALYTAPPRREWVGLTDDEVTDCYLDSSEKGILLEDAIEAKLKEKNA